MPKMETKFQLEKYPSVNLLYFIFEMREYYQGWERIEGNVVDTVRPIFEDENSFIWRAIEWRRERAHVMV